MVRIGLDHESSQTTTLSLPHRGTSRMALSQNLDTHPSHSTQRFPGKDALSAGASGVFSDVEWIPGQIRAWLCRNQPIHSTGPRCPLTKGRKK
jgi:hypothetical protein